MARLIAKLHAIKPDLDNFDEPCAVASLEDFFEGHEDRYSIASNLIEHPGSQAFYRLLSRIRSRSDVQDVLVQITQWEAEDEWPYSDTIFIITSAPLEEVREWVASLQPDEVLEGWTADEPPLGAPSIQPGTRPVTVWWD